MDMPLLIADIGRSSEGGIYDKLKKSFNPDTKSKKDLLNVFLDLNLDKGCIEFDVRPFYTSCEKDYNYFGNNASAGLQFYTVRDIDGCKNYWIGRGKAVFKNLTDILQFGELFELLKLCENLKLFDSKGLNCEKISFRNGESFEVKFVKEDKDKAIYVNNKKSSVEKLLLACIGARNTEKICLVVPRIIYNDTKYIISTHKDYLELCEKQMKSKKVKSKSFICHICNKQCDDVNTVAYSGKLSRSSISKAFVTTTVNYAPQFDKSKFDSAFSICGSCASLLKSGENKAMSEMKSRIAGIDAVLLFEGLYENIEYSYYQRLKKDVDIVFNTKDSEEWYDTLIQEINEEQKVENFYFSIIFYEAKKGQSCSIKKTIESVSNTKFRYIQRVFEESRLSISRYLKYFNLGHIYRIVPITTDKKGIQLNIKRVLNLISAVIQGELIDKNEIMELACGALEKGIMQLKSSELRNYRNLYSLEFFYNEQKKSKDSRYTDKYIKKIVMSYICFFKSLQKLNILNREVFKVENAAQGTSGLPEEIAEMEIFLNSNGYSREAKGLFYLGAMIYQIGVAQAKKQHTQKPILDKISFGGMNSRDVVQMYLDVMEKTRQYQKTVNLWRFERLQKQMHLNFGDLSSVRLLNEKENVFYIMSGYAFCVDNYKKANTDSEEEAENDC